MAGLPPAHHRIFRASRHIINLVSLADLSQTNGNELQRTINAHKLLRHTSTPTVDSELASVQTFTKQYREGLQFGDHLPTTELQPADDLAILAGQTFVSLWTMTGEQKHLYSAAAFLEYALTKSNQAFEMRLMLVRIYRLIAAPALALEQYRAMGAKNVQQDTLSHFILSRASLFSLAPVGDITMMAECMESMQIYLSNANEVRVHHSLVSPLFQYPYRPANSSPALSTPKSTRRSLNSSPSRSASRPPCRRTSSKWSTSACASRTRPSRTT